MELNYDKVELRNALFAATDSVIEGLDQSGEGTMTPASVAERVLQSLPRPDLFEDEEKEQVLLVLKLIADLRLRELYDAAPFDLVALHIQYSQLGWSDS
jgi:hypothetical protein